MPGLLSPDPDTHHCHHHHCHHQEVFLYGSSSFLTHLPFLRTVITQDLWVEDGKLLGSCLGQVGWEDDNDLEPGQAIAVSVQELGLLTSHTWLRIASTWGEGRFFPLKFFWNIQPSLLAQLASE